jgi:hypothetical protein
VTVKDKDKKIDKLYGWERALSDVQKEIGRAEMRARMLRNSAKIIRSKIEAGEPWPDQHPKDSEQQHSV